MENINSSLKLFQKFKDLNEQFDYNVDSEDYNTSNDYYEFNRQYESDNDFQFNENNQYLTPKLLRNSNNNSINTRNDNNSNNYYNNNYYHNKNNNYNYFYDNNVNLKIYCNNNDNNNGNYEIENKYSNSVLSESKYNALLTSTSLKESILSPKEFYQDNSMDNEEFNFNNEPEIHDSNIPVKPIINTKNILFPSSTNVSPFENSEFILSKNNNNDYVHTMRKCNSSSGIRSPSIIEDNNNEYLNTFNKVSNIRENYYVNKNYMNSPLSESIIDDINNPNENNSNNLLINDIHNIDIENRRILTPNHKILNKQNEIFYFKPINHNLLESITIKKAQCNDMNNNIINNNHFNMNLDKSKKRATSLDNILNDEIELTERNKFGTKAFDEFQSSVLGKIRNQNEEKNYENILPNSTVYINEKRIHPKCSKNSVIYGSKPFKCMVCNSSFKRKYDLMRHKRIHTGEKPFVCEICNKRFSRSDILKRHMTKSTKCSSKHKLI